MVSTVHSEEHIDAINKHQNLYHRPEVTKNWLFSANYWNFDFAAAVKSAMYMRAIL